MSEELVRLVDSIHRDKGVSKDILYSAVEEALAAAAKKRFKSEGEIQVTVDRVSGDISAVDGDKDLDLAGFGRIAARTAYQVMTQRIREAERDVIYEDFEAKLETLVTGTVQRIERGNLVVNLGRTEGIVPRQEQVFNETYRAGDRIRAYVLNVKKKGQKVVILLSRTHPNLIRELFKLEIPEVSDRIVELKNIVREPGFRTKVAVASNDMRVDPQGACIGVRGTRIRSIVDELSGERIDIIPWNESAEIYIMKALSPAEITAIDQDRDAMRARAIVPEDQLSLAIGKRGQNVRLAAKLTGWHIDILTEEEAHREREAMKLEMQKLIELFEWLDNSMLETMTLSGFSTLHAIQRKGAEKLLEVKGMDEDKAGELHLYAVGRVRELDDEKARRIQEERARAREEAAAAAAAAAAEAEAAAAAKAEAEAAAEAEKSGEGAAEDSAEGGQPSEGSAGIETAEVGLADAGMTDEAPAEGASAEGESGEGAPEGSAEGGQDSEESAGIETAEVGVADAGMTDEAPAEGASAEGESGEAEPGGEGQAAPEGAPSEETDGEADEEVDDKTSDEAGGEGVSEEESA